MINLSKLCNYEYKGEKINLKDEFSQNIYNILPLILNEEIKKKLVKDIKTIIKKKKSVMSNDNPNDNIITNIKIESREPLFPHMISMNPKIDKNKERPNNSRKVNAPNENLKRDIQEIKKYIVSLQNNDNMMYRNMKLNENAKTILNINDLNLINKQNSDYLNILRNNFEESGNEKAQNGYHLNTQTKLIESRIRSILNKTMKTSKERPTLLNLKEKENQMYELLESMYEKKKNLNDSFNLCIEECKINIKRLHRNMGDIRDQEQKERNQKLVEETMISGLKSKINNLEDTFLNKVIGETNIIYKEKVKKSRKVRMKTKNNPNSVSKIEPVIIKLKKVQKEKEFEEEKFEIYESDDEKDQIKNQKLMIEKNKKQIELKNKVNGVIEEPKSTINTQNKRRKRTRVQVSSNQSKILKTSKNIKKKAVRRKRRTKPKDMKAKLNSNLRKEEDNKPLKNEYDANKSLYINSELCTRKLVYNRITKLRESTKLVNLEKINKENEEAVHKDKLVKKVKLNKKIKNEKEKVKDKVKEKKKKKKKKLKVIKYFEQESMISLAPDEMDSNFSSDSVKIMSLEFNTNQTNMFPIQLDNTSNESGTKSPKELQKLKKINQNKNKIKLIKKKCKKEELSSVKARKQTKRLTCKGRNAKSGKSKSKNTRQKPKRKSRLRKKKV